MIIQNPDMPVVDKTYYLLRESDNSFSLPNIKASELISSINENQKLIKTAINEVLMQLDEITIAPASNYHGMQLALAELAKQKHSSIAA